MKKYNNIILDYETNAYSTHQPLIIWAIENTSGNILELGAGDGSTILLNSSILNSNRKLVTVDDDYNWLNKYSKLESENHKFLYVNNTIDSWNKLINDLSQDIWAFVLVDHATLENIWRVSRPYAMKKFLNCSEYVIAHDADLFPEIKTDEYFWHEYVPSIKPLPHRNGPSSYLLSAKHDLNKLDKSDFSAKIVELK